MAKKKKIIKIIKLQIVAGKATPAPPIGPALGSAGLNIMNFCKEFNARTQESTGLVLPVEITVYDNKEFTFITKQPPAPKQILKELNLPKGSGVPNRDKVGTINQEQLRKIAKAKMQDMNANSEESAMKTLAGTARSMGIDVIA